MARRLATCSRLGRWLVLAEAVCTATAPSKARSSGAASSPAARRDAPPPRFKRSATPGAAHLSCPWRVRWSFFFKCNHETRQIGRHGAPEAQALAGDGMDERELAGMQGLAAQACERCLRAGAELARARLEA